MLMIQAELSASIAIRVAAYVWKQSGLDPEETLFGLTQVEFEAAIDQIALNAHQDSDGEYKMGRKEVEFVCPKCGNYEIEEVRVVGTMTTEIYGVARVDDGHIDHFRGKQTSEDGYIDRYQCEECGYTIVDGHSEFAEDGLDDVSLFKALEALQNKRR